MFAIFILQSANDRFYQLQYALLSRLQLREPLTSLPSTRFATNSKMAPHIDEHWDVTVINHTELDEIWKPDDEEVVVYTRLDSMQPGTFPSTSPRHS